MNRYNVRTYIPVEVNGVAKRYEAAFGSGSENSSDQLSAGNCNKLGAMLEATPQMFTDETGKQLEEGQLYNEGYIGVGGPVVTVISRIGSGAQQQAFITLADGTKVPLPTTASPTSANGGNLPK